MSFDLAVWAPSAAADDRAAAVLYAALLDGDHEALASLPVASVQEFYSELTSRHPEIEDVPEDDVDDLDLCPWSAAFDRSEGHVILCSVWSRAEYVLRIVTEIAHRHGLAIYDPQAGSLHLPSPRGSKPTRKPWWRWSW